MSMWCELTMVPAEACAQLQRQFNTPEGQEQLLARWPRPEPAKPGIARRILSVFWSKEEEEDDAEPESEYFNQEYDALLKKFEGVQAFDGIDQNWHLLHFFLTGQSNEDEGELGFMMSGGLEIDGTDAGYGPHRLLTPERVVEISAALARYTPDDLVRIWKERGERASREVYGGSVLTETSPDDPANVDHWMTSIRGIRVFFDRAADRHCGVILDIS